MGDIYIALNGGGGITSDEVTVTSANVLQGKTFVGADTDDEIGIGTMPNNPAQNVSLNCGQSVTIPLGYNPGSIITANSLASQTGGATADDSKVLSSYTYWKDGIKRTGNLSVTSVVSFNAAQYSNLTLIASWAKPSKGPWSGLRVMCKQGGYPANANDGTLFYEGSGTSATKSLASGTWYFRAWNYLTTSTGRMYGNYADQSVTNTQVRGQQAFTSSGVFTIPAYVYNVQIFVVGGGGSGGDWSTGYPFDAGGGGGGYTNTGAFNVTPGQQLSITIGAGGSLANGGTTSVSGLISASGGYAGYVYADHNGGGNGGSGGGGGSNKSGGSDGNDGVGTSKNYVGGIGQHTTTRAFGESSNTLYAGGGGSGYAPNYSASQVGGPGGAGGGGNGAYAGEISSTAATPGSFGTGGGGGGGFYDYDNDNYHSWSAKWAPGGSGICIIRWGY